MVIRDMENTSALEDNERLEKLISYVAMLADELRLHVRATLPSEVDALTSRVDAIGVSVSSLDASVSSLEARISALEGASK